MHRTIIQHTVIALALLTTPAAHAQWELEDSGTTASLRGVHYVGGGVVWASGTDGTVLRSEDSGYVWQGCATPPGAEHLDFRAVEAFDENTALVMSSGPGDQSRLYKTTDGCLHWKLLVTNPDKDGFWDALSFDGRSGTLVGDPVDGRFAVWTSIDSKHWMRECKNTFAPQAKQGEAVFAASNSSLITFARRDFMLATGGTAGSRTVFFETAPVEPGSDAYNSYQRSTDLPFTHDTASSGVFSLAMRNRQTLVAVGGDYTKPDQHDETSAYTPDGGVHWYSSQTPPHGYRSAVAYDPTHKAWITVGPNGTDISTDDGRNWRPLTPHSQDQPGADRDWNALSLPFVVGPHGRIGKLRPSALPAAKPAPPKPSP